MIFWNLKILSVRIMHSTEQKQNSSNLVIQ